MSQVTLLAGAVWGFVGAITMLIVMRTMGGEGPSPFAAFWAKFIGNGNPSDAMPQALLLHASYAISVGIVYVLIFTPFDLGIPITTFVGGIIWGIVWAIVLMMVAAIFLMNLVLDMNPDQGQMMTMGVAHMVFGLTLGLLAAAVPHIL